MVHSRSDKSLVMFNLWDDALHLQCGRHSPLYKQSMVCILKMFGHVIFMIGLVK